MDDLKSAVAATTPITGPGFAAQLAAWPAERVRAIQAAATPGQVQAALRRDGELTETDLAVLLSPAGATALEALARRSVALTRQRFGRVIQFFAPLYVSNRCVNSCAYCGFNCRNRVPRRLLTLDEAETEAGVIAREGFRHLLLVSGEDRAGAPPAYFAELTRRLRRHFASVSIEIYPLKQDEYAELVAAGVDGLTVFQETYDAAAYPRFHPAGPKSDFLWRLNAMERGGAAGMTFLGVAALLGLTDWRVDAFHTALHARWLQRRFWRSSVSISFPRLRPAAGEFMPDHPLSDAGLVQILCAQRLYLPDVNMVLSTREPAALRERLTPLGFTRLSAGSKTTPGGYAVATEAEAQFEVQDARSLGEVMAMVARLGLDPVCKDWDDAYHAA